MSRRPHPAAALPLVLLVAIAMLLPSCRTVGWLLHRPPVLEACPGPLPSAHSAPEGLRRRARVRVAGAGVDESFTVVLEAQAEGLAVLGVTRLGAKAFALRQRGTEIEVVTPRSPVFPVPPESLLRDLHAAGLLAAGEPVRVRRPGCAYEVRFVPLVEEEAEPSAAQGAARRGEAEAAP